MDPAAPTDRYHALDCLRGFAMFLGVLLHAAISFTVQTPVFWPVRDNDPNPLFDVALFAIHDFRMQLFFLLAGFFGCLLYLKYGPGGMARHRAKRVLVPFVLGLVFIIPTVMGSILFVELENIRAGDPRTESSPARVYAQSLIVANPTASSLALMLDALFSGDLVDRFVPVHLWFLYYLLIFYVVVLLIGPLLARLSGTRFLARLDGSFRALIEGRGRVFVPALLTLPLMYCMQSWIVDTPVSWVPPLHLLVYYGGFFAFGWLLFRHRDLVNVFGRGWVVSFFVANVLVLPAMLHFLLEGTFAEKGGHSLAGWRVCVFVTSVLYTWLMIVALWGAFLHGFHRERAWVRYMADASYWCYLMSITPIILLQFWVKDWPLPGFVKFVYVTFVTMVLLLVTYEWCVRYTFIGAILNGRKYRHPPTTETAPCPAPMTENPANSAPSPSSGSTPATRPVPSS